MRLKTVQHLKTWFVLWEIKEGLSRPHFSLSVSHVQMRPLLAVRNVRCTIIAVFPLPPMSQRESNPIVPQEN